MYGAEIARDYNLTVFCEFHLDLTLNIFMCSGDCVPEIDPCSSGDGLLLERRWILRQFYVFLSALLFYSHMYALEK